LFPGERDDSGDVEIGADRFTGFTDEVRFVGLEAVQSETVLLGVNGDRSDAEFMGRAEDADGNFTAVGDEELTDRVDRSHVVVYVSLLARRNLQYPDRGKTLRAWILLVYENRERLPAIRFPGRAVDFIR
jgi:hypothetical protein